MFVAIGYGNQIKITVSPAPVPPSTTTITQTKYVPRNFYDDMIMTGLV